MSIGKVEYKKDGEPKLVEDYEEEEKTKDDILTAYRNIVDILKEWIDLKEEYYNLVALWIMGTYLHEHFPTFPYLFLNAMKGSGKTRTLKLITYLAKDGEILGSLTEAVLFRTSGTLAIDEFEGLEKKEALRELLNSAYKKGTKVKRMKKIKTLEGEKQVVEEFSVYRPILMANIWGMESVLGDRCITLILDKSAKTNITNLVELFEFDPLIFSTKELLKNMSQSGKKEVNLVSLAQFVSAVEVYKSWNKWLKNDYNSLRDNYTNNINTIYNINNINYTPLFEKLKFAGINGRDLELGFPLILLSNIVGELETTLTSFLNLMREKKEEETTENKDILLIDFVSQEPEKEKEEFCPVNELTKRFREHGQINEEWINSWWMGRALKRLNLIKQRRRLHRGSEVILDIKKAQEKMRMFK